MYRGTLKAATPCPYTTVAADSDVEAGGHAVESGHNDLTQQLLASVAIRDIAEHDLSQGEPHELLNQI